MNPFWAWAGILLLLVVLVAIVINWLETRPLDVGTYDDWLAADDDDDDYADRLLADDNRSAR